ncbi:ATP-binding cassette domain-containing protein [Citricoccus sp. GCM10030269]|uniref:branched-chain amino acid ABC transporter ATP-binding protein/permease n=1 Tax=Citricoccus sp. GCM10030269 TaxID=3273388 RepID=UPI00360F4693
MPVDEAEVQSRPADPASRSTTTSRVRNIGAVAVVPIVLVLALAPFGLAPFALGILSLGLVYGLLAYALDLSWGRVGLLSVGHAAFFGLGAYAVAVGEANGIPMVPAALAGVAVAAALAGLIALIALSVPGETSIPLFILLTLGTSQLLQRTANSLREVTGGANGITGPYLDVVGSYYLVLGAVVGTVALTYRLMVKGRRGAFQLAVLFNPVRAEHLGINARRTSILAFAVSGGVAAVAGALFAPVAGLVTPSTVGLALSTSVLTWLALGGKGSLYGPFVGAIVLTIGQQVLGGTWQSWYIFATAALFVLIIQVAPGGLAGLVRTWMGRGQDIPSLPANATPLPRKVPTGTPGAPLLELTSVSQSFGRIPVLQDVSLTVERGQCVCLIGPNGAGKSTLLSLIAGHLNASEGSVLLRGENVKYDRVSMRARQGVGRLFQVPSVFTELTVADNLRLAALTSGADTAKTADTADTAEQGTQQLAGELSMAERRHLELDMVLQGPPELVLLDEPAAGLCHQDARALASRLRTVVTESGCGMVVVEHDMDIVRELADVVVVLANGSVIASGSMDEVVADDAVRQAYLGVS